MAKNGRENLKRLTSEEAREYGSKGGKASVKARRKKKELKECMQALLESEITASNGVVMTGAEALCTKVFQKALKGDLRAFEVARDTSGQKPAEKVQLAEVDQSTVSKVEKIFND